MPFLQVLACVAILNAVVNIAVYLATIVAGEFTNCLLPLVRFRQILEGARAITGLCVDVSSGVLI